MVIVLIDDDVVVAPDDNAATFVVIVGTGNNTIDGVVAVTNALIPTFDEISCNIT
jgi:hypothetical protein